MSFHSQLTDKIISIDCIAYYVNAKKFTGKKIVFTNGCFDILHAGHVDYLTQARDLGDVLIVGLNTDDSVKKLNKGSDRPINTHEARSKVLAALGCIDAIVYFTENTPYELIKLVQPHILVKGGDWKAEEIIGSDVVTAAGGKVVTIPFLNGFSTTGLITKMKG